MGDAPRTVRHRLGAEQDNLPRAGRGPGGPGDLAPRHIVIETFLEELRLLRYQQKTKRRYMACLIFDDIHEMEMFKMRKGHDNDQSILRKNFWKIKVYIFEWPV